ncbi:hypothetical protein BDF22DRAFT_689133 [Syncephalis plumigaleata]|nr:hypothetical protein BDF22DRAFT_689133 [Syncephalis plumigaleata]
MADFDTLLNAELAACKANLAYMHNPAETWALDSLGVFERNVDEGHVERIVAALKTAYLAGNYSSAIQTIGSVLRGTLTSSQFTVLLTALTLFVTSDVMSSTETSSQVAISLLGVLLPIIDMEKLVQHLPPTLPVRNQLISQMLKVLVQQINRLPINLQTSQLVLAQKTMDLLQHLLVMNKDNRTTPIALVDAIHEISIGDEEHWALDGILEELRKRRLALAELLLPPADPSCASYAWNLAGRKPPVMQQVYKQLKINWLPSQHGNPLLYRLPMCELLSLTKAGRISTTTELVDAFFQDLEERVMACSEQISQTSSEKFTAKEADNADIFIPNDFSSFMQVIQLADELYTLVDSEIVTFEVVTDKFLNIARRMRQQKKGNVNYLLWLLLQLFHIEKVGEAVIAADLASDERLLAKITELCDEKIISMVDLAMPCSICHQQKRLKDKNLIKFPSAMLLAQACSCSRWTHFANAYKANIVQRTLLQNLTIDEIMRISIVSQLRQHLVADTLYVYLVPCDNLEIEKMPFSNATFLKGGILSTSLLSLVSIDCRHRLLQLIYKMMLDHEFGPRFPNAVEANSVSPYVLEVVASIIYFSPSSAELMISEVFERLRRVLAKLTKKEDNTDNGNSTFSETTWRWICTMAELLNGRLLGFLRYPLIGLCTRSSLTINLLVTIIAALPNIQNRRVYAMLENLCANLLSNGRTLRDCVDILDQVSFTGFPMLARVIMRVVGFIWNSNKPFISEANLEQLLVRISAEASIWPPETAQYFPEPIKSFVQQTASLVPPPIPLNMEPEALLALSISDFTNAAHQNDIYVYLWWKCIKQANQVNQLLTEIRPILKTISPFQLMHAIVRLAEHVNLAVGTLVTIETACVALNQLTWQSQVINPAKFTMALARCTYYLDNTIVETSTRWTELFPCHRYWQEKDYHSQLMTYLKEYPEFSCFEQCGEPLEVNQEALPSYFYSNIMNIANMLYSILGLFLEGKRIESAILMLDNLGSLWKYTSAPLDSMNSFLLYYQSALLQDYPRLTIRVLSLLRDFNRYPFSPHSIDLSIEQIVDRLIRANDYRKPEWRMKQQYREYVDPHIEMLHIIVMETNTMLWPADTVVQATLDYLYKASTTTPLSTSQIGAIAQWYDALPRETFLFPLVMAIVSAILATRYFELISMTSDATIDNTTTKSTTQLVTPLMALLASLYELKQFVGDAILAPLVEAISMRPPDLVMNGRVLRVPQLLALGLDTIGEQPAIASTGLFHLLGLLLESTNTLEQQQQQQSYNEDIIQLLDFTHLYIRGVPLSIDVLMQAQSELNAIPDTSLVRDTTLAVLGMTIHHQTAIATV